MDAETLNKPEDLGASEVNPGGQTSKLCHLPTAFAGACGTLSTPIEVAAPDEPPARPSSSSSRVGLGAFDSSLGISSSMQAQQRRIAAMERVASPPEEVRSRWEARRAEGNRRGILPRIFHHSA